MKIQGLKCVIRDRKFVQTNDISLDVGSVKKKFGAVNISCDNSENGRLTWLDLAWEFHFLNLYKSRFRSGYRMSSLYKKKFYVYKLNVKLIKFNMNIDVSFSNRKITIKLYSETKFLINQLIQSNWQHQSFHWLHYTHIKFVSSNHFRKMLNIKFNTLNLKQPFN